MKRIAWVIAQVLQGCCHRVLCVSYWLRLKEITKRKERERENDSPRLWSPRAGHSALSQREDLEECKGPYRSFPRATTSNSPSLSLSLSQLHRLSAYTANPCERRRLHIHLLIHRLAASTRNRARWFLRHDSVLHPSLIIGQISPDHLTKKTFTLPLIWSLECKVKG